MTHIVDEKTGPAAPPPPSGLPSLPCLTADVPPVSAAIKRRYEDFEVEEIPAYEPCGEGDHTYFVIEKAGLATMRAVRDIARALGLPNYAIGMAGLKDARAVTRQMLSVEHVDPQRIAELDIPRIRIVSVTRHRNKLRIGHLRGNRFVIKLREIDRARLSDVRSVLDVLARRGVPNYFGAQRFGSRGDTGLIGAALLRNDPQTAVELIAGRPGPHDTGPVLRARQLFAEGKFEQAAQAWPWSFRDCVRICRTMARTGGNARRAVHVIDRRMATFYVSALQSMIFNAVVAARIGGLDRVMAGDLAYKHDNGSIFHVEDAAAETPRAERFEISPTGPLFGHRMTQPAGEPDRIERQAVADQGFSPEDFSRKGRHQCPGGRRPLRFKADDLSVEPGTDDAGPFVALRFALPAGCYATSLLREVCKDRLDEGLVEEE